MSEHCPTCGEPWGKIPVMECSLKQSWFISIPAGQHIHINCPVHGHHRIDGPPVSLWSLKDRIRTP